MSIFVNPARKISPSYDKHGDRRGIIQSWFASVQITFFSFICRILAELQSQHLTFQSADQ